MERFISFIQSTLGRTIRILAGLLLIVIGVVVIPGTWGIIVAAVGLLPLFAGMSKTCLIAPLFGYTWDGQKRTRAF